MIVELNANPSAILVVEDDAVARNQLAQLLRDRGAVRLAEHGQAALDALAEGFRPALILLDMILPGVDGWAFMSRRRMDPALADIPVVITTGLTVASEEWAQSLGAVKLLRKPVDLACLLDVVAQFTN